MNLNEIFRRLGIESLNTMQQETMEMYRRASDMVLISPTGSGKTLAYLLPLLQTVNTDSDTVQALVLVPSRELAMQTQNVMRQIGGEYRSMAVYGGRPAMDEHRTMTGIKPHIIIGTPGRVNDHLIKDNFSTSDIHTLIIDEFDKSLELGFQDEMSQVLSHLGRLQKRFLLSATDCEQIPCFVGTGSQVARLDYSDEESTSSGQMTLNVVPSPVKDKLEILRDLLCTLGQQSSIVFVGFRESVERVAKYLQQQGLVVSSFHGGMEQRDRERALFRFVSGSANILVSTDLSARGLDIPQLDNVIHYHLPLDEQAFVHRNGRTARWDAEGRAWLILGPEEHLPTYIDPNTECWHRPSCIPQPQQPRWEALYIGKGKKDKLSRGDIAGFMMKIGGLERDELGKIDVREHCAYVSVHKNRVKELLLRVRGQKIKGLKTIIEPTR